jgi:16S rRNA (cytosine1402-N4)-methyltransferase
MTKLENHQPVLLQEVIEHLAINPDGIYIDATFGRGGHSREILQRLNSKGRLLAIDQDPQAQAAAKKEFTQDQRFTFIAGSFKHLQEIAQSQDILGKVQGVLLDLGVSTPQLANPQRGFSFLHDGPLDMRMDTTKGLTAADWLNTAEQNAIADVFKRYGEERFARRIAASIVRARTHEPITTTSRLAQIIAAAQPVWQKGKHPATRCFQALRIFINDELAVLQMCLQQSLEVLAVGGRLLAISFHSLEDRIVKQFIRQHARGEFVPASIPLKHSAMPVGRLRELARVKPSHKEVAENPRARSAILRVAEKLS